MYKRSMRGAAHRLENGIRAGDLGGYAKVLRQEHAADEGVGGGEDSPQDRLRQRPLGAVPALVLPPLHLRVQTQRVDRLQTGRWVVS